MTAQESFDNVLVALKDLRITFDQLLFAQYKDRGTMGTPWMAEAGQQKRTFSLTTK